MKTLSALLLVLLFCSAEALFGQNTTVPRNTAVPNDAGYFPFPKEISYQGLLTTSSGTPAADGNYDLKFDIFNVSGGGVSIWSETQNAVAVANGVFSVRLGSVTPLPDLFYGVAYLEVAALAGPGIGGTVTFAPRTQLTAAAYSLAPWATQGYDVYFAPPAGNVMVGTDTADGSTKLLVKAHGKYAGRFESDSLANNVDVVHAVATGTGSADAVGVYGESIPQDWWGVGGEFVGGYHGVNGFVFPTGGSSYTGVNGGVYGGSGVNIGVYGNADGGAADYGVIAVAADSATNYAGYFSGRLRVSSNSGDSAAMFPDNAVTGPEILDEPGFAAHSPYNSVNLAPGATLAVDSVTITIPADGYVIVQAGGILQQPNHVRGALSVTWANIGTAPGQTISGSSYQSAYTPDSAAGGFYQYNFLCHRVFQQSAGTYTYYLNAKNNLGANNQVAAYKWITATYYSTTYGPVTESTPGAEAAAEFQSDAAAGTFNAPAVSGTEVDLRTLELNALRARAQAEAAERQLLEARLAQEREKRSFPDQR